MKNKRRYLLIGIIVIFAGYAAWIFADAVTPYVTIEKAMASPNSVQVKGLLDKQAPAPQMIDDRFVFTLQDEEGQSMEVRYHGTKPDQFDEAYHIVAIGKYHDNAFYADKLLIKCPSKYEKKR